VPVGCLAERYGTPLYVYDAATIRDAFFGIRGSVPYASLQIHYASVTNSNIAVMKTIRALGGGIHASTWGDAVVALRAGVSTSEIVYSGSNLDLERRSVRSLLGSPGAHSLRKRLQNTADACCLPSQCLGRSSLLRRYPAPPLAKYAALRLASDLRPSAIASLWTLALGRLARLQPRGRHRIHQVLRS